MKRDRIIYWIVTILLSAWMLLQAFMFVFNSDQIAELFDSLGVSTSLIIPLGIAKFLAVVAILSKLSALLKKLAYLGLAVDFIAALVLHLIAGDGGFGAATIALVVVALSYFYDRRVFV